MLEENERRIASEINACSCTLINPDWQRLYNVNNRFLLSLQDASGAIHAALRSLYYLIWQMDGSVVSSFAGHCGWTQYLERWCVFMLANPTVSEHEPSGRYFGQLVNGKITKREEWGLFLALKAAFTYWTQTGDARFLQGNYLQTELDALDLGGTLLL